ncbi:hypothetical protein [Sphingobacterium daejeonense]|uniref:hypothetical protein n=1 Tax=Sphingobacterium daejeonense TaxID=371142 RepID=UPI0010C54FB5|nr:hypothetical protein [Sphingobacterium daejeonense]VTP93759.1 Uncharacterised protein [Sphingobacterium daejeonense]
MTKLFRNCLLLSLLLTGCVSNNKEEQATDSTTVENPEEYNLSKTDILEDYILALDSSDIESVGKATAKFKELFDQRSDSIQNDKGVALIMDYIDKVSMYGSRSAFEEDVNYRPLVNVEFDGGKAAVPEDLEQAYEKINKNGFRVREVEGMFDLEANPIYFQENFYPFISSNLEIFLQQQARDNMEGFAADAAISIPFQTLVQRTIWYEDFANKTKGTTAGEKAKKEYDKYFGTLTIGMDNTPAIESQQLAPYFQEAYTYLKDFAPNSETYKKLEPYIALLQEQKIDEAKALLPNLIGRGI